MNRLNRMGRVVYVVIWMTFVELAVRIVRLDVLARRLGVLLSTGQYLETAKRSSTVRLSQRRAARLRTLNRVSTYWPLGAAACLPRSLVAGRILKEMQPVLRIGVVQASKGRPREKYQAHAWIEIDGLAMDSDAKHFHPLVTRQIPDSMTTGPVELPAASATTFEPTSAGFVP